MAERDAEQKSKVKAYANTKLGTKPSDIKPRTDRGNERIYGYS